MIHVYDDIVQPGARHLHHALYRKGFRSSRVFVLDGSRRECLALDHNESFGLGLDQIDARQAEQGGQAFDQDVGQKDGPDDGGGQDAAEGDPAED